VSDGRRQNEINYRRSLFEEKFTRRGAHQCWPWTAATTKFGHGIFGLGPLYPGGVKPAHVASWFFYRNNNFDLEAPLRFHHLCGEFSCVNPDHLAIFGAKGIQNDETVLRFLAGRHAKLRKELLVAAEKVSRAT
jgi:hypothetical protein